MTRSRVQALLSILALAGCWAAPAPTARAAAVDRYRVERDGVVFELTAPRADILRIRAGRGSLPEDASWAVGAAARRQRVPLELTSDARGVVLRTPAIVARLDPLTLYLRIEDAAVHPHRL